MGGSLFSSDLNEPEKEGVEDKLETLSGAYGQMPPVRPRASEGTGLVLNVTEARGLHSGGPGLLHLPPQVAGGAGVPVLSLRKWQLLRAQGWQDEAKAEWTGRGSDGAAHGLGVRGRPKSSLSTA